MKILTIVLLALALAPAAMAQTAKKKHKTAPAPQAETKQAAKATKTNEEGPSGGVPGEPDIDGCGLGWQVTDSQSIIGAITRGTTNGTVPPSFGMTSGSLGCKKVPFTKRDQAGATYAVSNYDSLRIEMAEGQGEVLAAFARTLGCGDTAAFGRMTKKNYGTLLEGQSTPVRMFYKVKQQIQLDPALTASCAV